MPCLRTIRFVAAFALAILVAPPAMARDRYTTTQIIELAIRAHGGRDNLLRGMTRFYRDLTVFGTGEYRIITTTESWERIPDQMRQSSTHTDSNGEQLRMLIVFDGSNGWCIIGEEQRPLTKQEKANLVSKMYMGQVCALVPLLDTRAFTTIRLPDEVINEKCCYSLKVSLPSHKTVYLYIDKQTGLTVSTRYAGMTYGGSETFVTDLTLDYQVVCGTKISRTVHRWGELSPVREETMIYDARPLTRIDPALLRKPYP